MSIRIITDSASDVFRDKYPLLEVLPMTITFGEEQFLDGVNLSREEFYLKLVETDAMPSTSQISPYDFEEAFKRARQAGDQALVITMSGRLSGTYQSALSAAEGYGDIVRVVDSRNVTVGEHILVDYAVKLREQGLALEELAGELGFDFPEAEGERLKGVSRMDSLEIVLESGRITGLTAEEKKRLADRKNKSYLTYINRLDEREILPGILKFLKKIWDETPGGCLKAINEEPFDEVISIPVEENKICNWMQTTWCSYELHYFGIGRPAYRILELPEDASYQVEVIDTWNMTITDTGVHSGFTKVELPGQEWMAIRIIKK